MAKVKSEQVRSLVSKEEEPYDVPQNWKWVYWGNAGQFIAGSGFPNSYQGFMEYEIPFFKVGNLKQADEHGYLYESENTVNDTMRVQMKASLIPDHSILFAKIGEAIRLNRRSINVVPCCIDNNMMAFVPQICDMLYAYYWSLGIDLYQLTNATTVPAIRKSDLEVIPLPIPPLPEQQRIVDRIESLFAKLDEAKEKAQAVVDGFEDRKAAILHKAFTGELTAEWRKDNGVSLSSWTYEKIGEFAKVRGGKRLPKGYSLQNEKTEHPYIRIADLGENTVDLANIQYISDEVYRQISRYIIEDSDVYISIVGTIGKSGTIPAVLNGANLTENAARISTARTLPRYLASFLNSPAEQEDIQGRIRSATLGKLSLYNINDITVPLPSKDEQQVVVDQIDKLFALENSAKNTAEQVISQIETMKKAILARAFRGELGTNDPSEPPADIGIS